MTGKTQEGREDPVSGDQLILLTPVKESFIVLGHALTSQLENIFYLKCLPIVLSSPEHQNQMTAKESM